MALLTFLDNTCDIIEKSKTNVAGEVSVIETTVYSDIPCHFYKQTASLDDTNISNNTVNATNRVIVEPGKTLIRKGMILVLKDPDFLTEERYLAEGIQMNRFSDSSNDSIQIDVKNI